MLEKRKDFGVYVALIAVLVMILALFLPYAAATPAFRQVMETEADQNVMLGDSDISMLSTLRVSMVEFIRIYSVLGGSSLAGSCVMMVVGMGLMALLAALAAWKRKPVLALVLDFLAFIVFVVHNQDYKMRGVIPSAQYRWGLAYYLFFSAAVMLAVGAVWILQEKKREEAEAQAKLREE